MTIREKIGYLKLFEVKLIQAAKYILIVFACITCACLFLCILHLIDFVFVGWSIILAIGSIYLLGIIDIFVKFAISFESFAIKDNDMGRDNLFPALLGTFLLLPIFFLFLSPFLGTGKDRSRARDARRLADMRQMFLAQDMYYADYNRYFTCGVTAGDCGKTENNYPQSIGNYLTPTPSDPMGNTNPYSGLDNISRSDTFCYYAILENINKTVPGCERGCGFYSATPQGNFYVERKPLLFDDCINMEQLKTGLSNKQ